jgi:hypothetical protein
MRNISKKSCTENQNTRFIFSNFFPKNLTVCEMLPKNMVETVMPEMTIWRRAACCIIKATRAQANALALARAPTPTPLPSTHTHTEMCDT